MTTDGGGWTHLFTTYPDDTKWAYNSSEWTTPTINYSISSNIFTDEITSQAYKDLPTNSIKICRKDLSHCFIMNHNLNIALQTFFTNNIHYVDTVLWS